MFASSGLVSASSTREEAGAIGLPHSVTVGSRGYKRHCPGNQQSERRFVHGPCPLRVYTLFVENGEPSKPKVSRGPIVRDRTRCVRWGRSTHDPRRRQTAPSSSPTAGWSMRSETQTRRRSWNASRHWSRTDKVHVPVQPDDR